MSKGTTVLKGKLTVSELMSRELVTVPLGTPLLDVARQLTAGHCRHVLVTDAHGALAGVVSDRDVLRELVPGQPVESAAWQHKTVESVMVTKFMATTPKANPNDVVSVLVDGAIQCLRSRRGPRGVPPSRADDPASCRRSMASRPCAGPRPDRHGPSRSARCACAEAGRASAIHPRAIERPSRRPVAPPARSLRRGTRGQTRRDPVLEPAGSPTPHRQLEAMFDGPFPTRAPQARNPPSR